MNAIRTQLELNIQTFDLQRPKVLVISHERSGTHFLMNSLAANFGYIASPFINLDWSLGVNYFSAVAFQDLFSKFQSYSIANLFKSHHSLDFYRDFLPDNTFGFKVIYIYRDIYEVAVSYHEHLKGLPWHEGPHQSSLSEFLRQVPAGAMTRYQYRQVHSMVDRWVQHVESALECQSLFNPSDFLMIDYRDLNTRFEETVNRIASKLGLSPTVSVFCRPPRDQAVVPPILKLSEQKILSYYSRPDIDFIEPLAASTRARLGMVAP
jgi:hypothetical protein